MKIDLSTSLHLAPKQGGASNLLSRVSLARETPNQHSKAVNDSVWRYRIVGLLLLIAYFLQDAYDLKLDQLEQLQHTFNYKIFSGVLLFAYILMQWRLPVAGWLNLGVKQCRAKRRSHILFGAIAPLVFYLHATTIGTAYLAALSSVYLANSFLGCANGDFIPQAYKKIYLFGWTILHAGFSTCLLFLSTYHAYIALAYK